jgi:3-deoxy-D-manno-octulosonate 8-phosphate phosphatase (KDO 8-P phosphatase)
MPEMLFKRLKEIKAIVFDFDGVLTDGKLLLSESGEWLREVNIKDGFAIKFASERKYPVGLISGSGSETIRKRMEALGVTDVIMHSPNKLSSLKTVAEKHKLELESFGEVGDDIPDIAAMKASGLAACPQDAVPEVKAISHYICEHKGGEGCAREVILLVLKSQGRWEH